MNRKILIEVIVSNQCNKRCSYCDLDFYGKEIQTSNIFHLTRIIEKSYLKFNSITLNFFWGEPLLWFSKIQDIVHGLQHIENVSYSIGTNGLLIDKRNQDFIQNNDFKVYLSIDTETWYTVLNKNIFLDYDSVFINFIINPKTIDVSPDLLDAVIQKWYKNINLMPVFSTIPWKKDTLLKLDKIVKKYSIINGIHIQRYSYFNGVSADRQFILETNGSVYQDLDSLLWIQKQSSTIDRRICNAIESQTYINNIINIQSLEEIYMSYNQDKVTKLVKLIPKSQWYEPTYNVIDNIMQLWKTT